MSDIYKYNESIARFYDVVYENIKKDFGLEFYLEEIANANGPVLEIGSGTGRIFVPALKAGADIYGIDQSEMMTAKLYEKISSDDHKRISIQDVRSFRLDKKFKLVIAPFRMFSHLLNTNDQLKALNNIYNHLEEGGRFIFDVFIPNYKNLVDDTEDILEFEGEFEPRKSLKRLVRRKQNPIEQLIDITFKFVWDENGRSNESKCEFLFRYYFRYELEGLIERSPLKLEKIFGSFEKDELSNKSNEFVIVCKKLGISN